MTEKIIQPKTTSDFPNLMSTPDLVPAAVNDVTFLYDESNVNTPADYDLPAVGTITMSGIATLNETFIIDTQTFTWKTSRSGVGEVTRGASASEAVTNIVAAVTADLTTVTAVDGAGDTVMVQAVIYGEIGNLIPFSEASTNMAMDGAGFLGGTYPGDDNLEVLEELLITGHGYPTVLTASDILDYSYSLNPNDEVKIEYWIRLYDVTAAAVVYSFELPVIQVFSPGGVLTVRWAFQPVVTTIKVLVLDHEFTWGMAWKKHRTAGGTSIISGVSRSRILTVQEIKR